MSYRKLRDDLLERPGVRDAYNVQRELSRLGDLIQRTRRAAKLPQQELAAASGIAQADISRLESGLGERGPTFETLVRLAHAQGMNLVVEFVPADADKKQAADTQDLRVAF